MRSEDRGHEEYNGIDWRIDILAERVFDELSW